jgi:hypothetical protein
MPEIIKSRNKQTIDDIERTKRKRRSNQGD